MKHVYATGNLFFVRVDSSSPYKGKDKFVLMYGSGGINLGSLLTEEETLAAHPGGEWFDRATPSNFR